jgi:hypothetical protein
MPALVVYESMFGNTESIAEGLSLHISVATVEVGVASTAVDHEVALLVVGGPTHAFGMSRSGTRLSASNQAQHGVVSARIGLREWLAAIERGSTAVAAATFNTRIDKPRVPSDDGRVGWFLPGPDAFVQHLGSDIPDRW